ncbi:hypothetical protein AB0L06_12300 [Spirillospora sp. NPDC052269]
MNDVPSGIESLLARLCDGEIIENDYVGYFLNEFGEELVFAQRRGDDLARLWHSDADWQMFRIDDNSIRFDGPVDGMITVAGMIINRAEATWLSSVLAASRPLRVERRRPSHREADPRART